jgi:hypothetical protein
MSTPCNPQRSAGRRFFRAAVVFLSLGVSGVMFSAAAAAPQSGTNPPASAEERASLRQTLESRYEVLPVQGGIVLKPRQPKAGISTIEVTADGVAINGQHVPTPTLHDWLGADADLVQRLQGLSASEQRRIFGLEAGGGAPPAPTAPAAPPAAPDATTGETEVSDEPAAAETPEVAETPARHGDRHTSGSRVVLGSVSVDKDEVAEEAVAIGGSVTVDGEVEGDVTAVGGPARINGRVGGEVVSVGGGVYLGPNSEVEGGITSVGGSVHREPGAKVQGQINEVGVGPFSGRFGRHVHFRRFGHDWEPWPFWGGVSEVMGSIFFTVIMGLLVCLVLLIARGPLERVDRQLVARPWPSAAVGVAGFVFFWPLVLAVTILLAITIIGCALFLLYPFFFLFVGLLLLLGYAAVAYRLGRLVEGRFSRSFGSPYGAALVGVVLIQVWSIFGHMLDLLPGPFFFLSVVVGLFGFLTQAVAWIVGFGAVILSRFGLEPGHWQPQGAPAPPTPYERPVQPLPLSSERPADWHEPPQ